MYQDNQPGQEIPNPTKEVQPNVVSLSKCVIVIGVIGKHSIGAEAHMPIFTKLFSSACVAIDLEWSIWHQIPCYFATGLVPLCLITSPPNNSAKREFSYLAHTLFHESSSLTIATARRFAFSHRYAYVSRIETSSRYR